MNSTYLSLPSSVIRFGSLTVVPLSFLVLLLLLLLALYHTSQRLPTTLSGSPPPQVTSLQLPLTSSISNIILLSLLFLLYIGFGPFLYSLKSKPSSGSSSIPDFLPYPSLLPVDYSLSPYALFVALLMKICFTSSFISLRQNIFGLILTSTHLPQTTFTGSNKLALCPVPPRSPLLWRPLCYPHTLCYFGIYVSIVTIISSSTSMTLFPHTNSSSKSLILPLWLLLLPM